MNIFRLFLLLAISLPLAVAAQEGPIKVRADLWFPINGEPRAARPGFGIEILNAVWGAAGYRIDYQLTPWSRSLELVHTGQADCVIGAYPGDAPELLYPHEPLGFDGVGLYTLTGNDVDYQGPESLNELRVGVIGSYSYGAQLDAWVEVNQESPNLDVMRGSEALDKNIRKLLSGRLDVLLESPLVMQTRLEALKLEERITLAASVTPPMPVFVACGASRAARQWLKVHDDGLKRLQREGELAEIYRRYGIDPEKQRAMREAWPGRAPDGSSRPLKDQH